MEILYIILILIFFLALIGIFYIHYYNDLQYLKSKIEQSEVSVDEVLRDRFDLVVRTSEVVKTHLAEKKDYFKEYIALKEDKISNFDMDRKLKEAANIILNLKNDYPELQKDENMKEIVKLLRQSNEKLSATIAYYNRYTNELNTMIRTFPSNLLAKIHHFKIKPFFDGKDMNDDDVLDFKL